MRFRGWVAAAVLALPLAGCGPRPFASPCHVRAHLVATRVHKKRQQLVSIRTCPTQTTVLGTFAGVVGAAANSRQTVVIADPNAPTSSQSDNLLGGSASAQASVSSNGPTSTLFWVRDGRLEPFLTSGAPIAEDVAMSSDGRVAWSANNAGGVEVGTVSVLDPGASVARQVLSTHDLVSLGGFGGDGRLFVLKASRSTGSMEGVLVSPDGKQESLDLAAIRNGLGSAVSWDGKTHVAQGEQIFHDPKVSRLGSVVATVGDRVLVHRLLSQNAFGYSPDGSLLLVDDFSGSDLAVYGPSGTGPKRRLNIGNDFTNVSWVK
jgi:hypothetical protein